jgi:hypothetical protein
MRRRSNERNDSSVVRTTVARRIAHLSHDGEADEADAALFFVRHGVDADACGFEDAEREIKANDGGKRRDGATADRSTWCARI